MNKKKLKKKLLKHILESGKKPISEKILNKSFKSIQKFQKKSHCEIIKLAIFNSTPTFRIIKLKNKRKRKKSVKEIPAFFSTYNYRTSWGLKYLVKASTFKINNIFFDQLVREILSSAKNESNAVELKNELQISALEKKKYFRHYRW